MDGETRNLSAQKDKSFLDTFFDFTDKYNMLLIPIALIILAMAFIDTRFFRPINLYSIMRAASVYVIVGVAQTFIITTGNIDLSVGSMLGMIMGFVGSFLATGGSVPLAILLAMIVGLVAGAFNGFLVTKLGIPALLATLGMMEVYRGTVNQYLYGTTVSRFPRAIVYLGQGTVGPVPVPVIIAAIIAAICGFLYRYTKLGRYAIAIGDNEQAAIVAGIPVKRWKMIFFALSGLLVGIGALIYLGRMDSTNPGMGTGMELHVIVGVCLGGTLLFGGKGTMWGTLLGMVLISLINNSLMLAGAGFFIQQILLGALLVASVAFQIFRERKQGL